MPLTFGENGGFSKFHSAYDMRVYIYGLGRYNFIYGLERKGAWRLSLAPNAGENVLYNAQYVMYSLPNVMFT